MGHTVNRSTAVQLTLPETYYNLVTGASQGSVILQCKATPTGTVLTSGKVQIWIFDGVNRFLWKEMDLPTHTVSTTFYQPTRQIVGDGVSLSPTQILQASINVAATVDIITTVHDA